MFTKSSSFLESDVAKLLLYADQIKNLTYDQQDFKELGSRSRALFIAYKIRENIKHYENVPVFNIDEIIENLTQTLFPWIKPKYKALSKLTEKFSDKSRGIVIPTGKRQFQFTVLLITTLRKVLKCALPIQVYYKGPKDLWKRQRNYLSKFPNVVVLDISQEFWGESESLEGWAIKPWSILVSSFSQVILVDADVLFLQDPKSLLENSDIFHRFGLIFYHDRTFNSSYLNPKQWVNEIIPNPSHYAAGLRFFSGASTHEQDSGVVVFDKSRFENLFALLVICKMNSKVEREAVTYKKTHGDKESYWIAFELIGLLFQFSPTFGSSIGFLDGFQVCGGLFHVDENIKPLWWNGGLFANKRAQNLTIIDFEYYNLDVSGKNVTWEKETDKKPFCLHSDNHSLKTLSRDIQSRIKMYGIIFERILAETWELK